MAKSKAEPAARRPEASPLPASYFAWSRDPAVGLFAVLPLFLAYEALRAVLLPEERNGAEKLMLDALALIGSRGLLVLRVAFGVLVLFAAVSLRRRHLPWLKVALVSALEGSVYGLLLGPLAGLLATSAARVLHAAVGSNLVANLVGSMGAGIFEELAFRLGLMSVLLWAALRICKAFSLPRHLGLAAAIVGSALLFSAFHHLWAPFHRADFLFRTMAGVLLGVIFWLRGFGVVVYTHTLYDVHFYLMQGSA